MAAAGLLFLLAACIGVAWGRLCLLQHENAVLQPLRDSDPDPGSIHVMVGKDETVFQKQQVTHEEVHQPRFSPIDFTGDRLITCPFYTQCCNTSGFGAFQIFWTTRSTCCYDYAWLWCFMSATVLVVFCFVGLFAFWMNKRLEDRAARPSTVVHTGTARARGGNPMAVPMSTYTTRTSGYGCTPALPAGKTCSPIPPPPLALAPPPYMEKAPGMHSVETQTQVTRL